MLDVSGRVAWRGSIEPGVKETALGLSALPAGVYRVELDDGSNRAFMRLFRYISGKQRRELRPDDPEKLALREL